ncbi:uncharacterized protein LOC143923546 [Lithobates pipiens]
MYVRSKNVNLIMIFLFTDQDREHFIDRHRAALISRVPRVESILDDLLQHGLLTDEQYDTVYSMQTSLDKMRQLYCYVRTWTNTNKDIFCEVLKIYNGPLIQDLENSEIVPRAKKPKPKETRTGNASSPTEPLFKQEENAENNGMPTGVSTSGAGSSRKPEKNAKNKRLPPTYLRDALTCLCADIFTDPVTLPCGHTYCMACIKKTWENQHEREASCPECRRPYLKKPELHRNFRLCELVEAHWLQQEDAFYNNE